MIPERDLDQLPAGLAVALRLHEAGQDDGVIATALGVPEQSVPTLLDLARAKLAHLTSGPEPGAPHPPGQG